MPRILIGRSLLLQEKEVIVQTQVAKEITKLNGRSVWQAFQSSTMDPVQWLRID